MEVQLPLLPEAGVPVLGVTAPLLTVVNTTDFAAYAAVYPDSGDAYLAWRVRAIRYPGAVNIAVDIDWFDFGATTGDIRLIANLAAYTPNVDGAFTSTTIGSTTAATFSHLGTTAFRVMRSTITIASVAGLIADDQLLFRLGRSPGHASDTLGVAVGVLLVTLRYQDA